MRGKKHLQRTEPEHTTWPPLLWAGTTKCSGKPVYFPWAWAEAPRFPGPVPPCLTSLLILFTIEGWGVPDYLSFQKFSSSSGHTLIWCYLLPASPCPSGLSLTALGTQGWSPVNCSASSTPGSIVPIAFLFSFTDTTLSAVPPKAAVLSLILMGTLGPGDKSMVSYPSSLPTYLPSLLLSNS